MIPAEQGRLRTELLVDPAVLCPGPDLSPIKQPYRDMIKGMVYGPASDQHLASYFSTVETGTRAIAVTAGQLRQPLLRGSWGRLELVAAQTPYFYSLSTQLLRAESEPWAFGGPPTETELVRNFLCRDLMILLSDPQAVHPATDYDTIKHTLSSLVAETLITQEENLAILAIMMGVPVAHAYNLSITDNHETPTLSADVAWALRG